FIGGINLAAFLLLVIGGIVISYEPKRTLRGHRTTHISSIFLAAFFFALTFVLERVVFNHTPFLTGFIWTRIGAFLASLALLLYAPARIGIASWSQRRSMHTSGLFVINKVTAAVGFFFLSFSISQIPSATPESVGIVNALQGIQYVFIFLLALFFSVFYPSVLSEHTDAQTILLKSVAILLVVSGLFLLVCGQSFACGTVFGF
ncbi:MAG: hypothetical protein HYW88_02650, partial [Candidatus Sungbacteria bacterium]|nr:hypothetical protein [Candidatus Sungbacteria bacterium]